MTEPIRGFHDVRPHLGKLTAAKRKKIPAAKFGLPKSRKYPMPDREHAGLAKGRAREMEKKGKLSRSSEEKTDAKANRILSKRLKSY